MQKKKLQYVVFNYEERLHSYIKNYVYDNTE